MKAIQKLVLTLFFAVACTTLFAQKLDDVKEKISKKKFDEAKEKIDKELLDPKNHSVSDVWFYKSKIYYNLSKERPTDVTLLPAALEAMKKYIALEEKNPEGKRMVTATLEANETFFNIYTDHYKLGVKQFQAQDYTTALNAFKGALDAFDILSKHKFTTLTFDTTITIYAGFAAQNAKLYDEAARFYEKLVTNKIYDTTYIDAYKFLINHNLENTKDTAAALRYLEISEKAFPSHEDLWVDYEIISMGNDRTKKIARYKQITEMYPNNFIASMNYAVELYNNTFFGDSKGPDYGQNQERTREALARAISLQPNSAHGNFILSQFYVNQIYDIEDSVRLVRGTAAADVAKKKEMNARLDGKYDHLFTHSQKAFDLYAKEATLKAQDKANFRKTINQLIDYYTRKKQTDKIPPLEEKLKTLK